MSEAALLVPYSAEYLSLLARKGKLTSKKIGNTWYTTRPALEDYMKRQMIRTHVQNGNTLAAAHLGHSMSNENQASDVQNPGKKLLEDEITLRQLRSFRTDTNEYINRSGILVEDIKPGEPEKKFVEKKLVPDTTRAILSSDEPKRESPVEAIEHMFERVLEKRAVGKKTFHTTRARYKTVFSSRTLVAVAITCALLLTIFPVPLVFSFFEKSFTVVKEAIKDSNTVMGFRPGTHANEILLLDKEGNVSIMGHIETEGQLRSYVADGTAPIVVDSVTKVENLNADRVDGVSSEEFTLAFVTANGNVTTENVLLNGNVEIGKTLLVRGATRLLSSLQIDRDLKVFGNAEFANVLRVLGPAYFEGVLTAQNNIEAKGDINADGNLSVRKNIKLKGSLEAGSAVIAKSGSFGSLGVSGDFSAGGKITLGNDEEEIIIKSKNFTVDVGGNGSFDGSLGVAALGTTNLTATNSTTTNATTTNLYAVNAIFDNLSTSGGSLTTTGLTFTNATGTNATTTNFYSETISGLIGYITSIVADDVSVGALTATNSTTTNATSTNLYAENATIDNVTATTFDLTNLTFDIATGTAATTTNFYSSQLTGDNLQFTNATGTNAQITNLEFTNATGTNSTTTSSFSTTASSTNLYSTNANLGIVVLGNATTTNLFSTTASSTNLFSTNFNLGTGTLGTATAGSLTVSSLTSGRVPFATTAGLLTDSSLFTFDSSVGRLTTTYASTTALTSSGSAYFATAGGNVGIGTTAPEARLHLDNVTGKGLIIDTTQVDNPFEIRLESNSGVMVYISGTGNVGTIGGFYSAFGTASFPSHSFGSDYNIGMFRPASGQLGFSTGGTERVRIDSSGNVGVGTTTPATKLDVYNGDVSISSGYALQFVSSNLDYNKIERDTSNGGLAFFTGGTQKLTILDNGNVGIGTANPLKLFEVKGSSGNGSLQIDPSSTYGTYIRTTAGSNQGILYLAPSSPNVFLYDNSQDYQLGIYSGSTAKISLKANGDSYLNGGNIGIGTTTPAGLLHVYNNSGSANVAGQQNDSGSSSNYIMAGGAGSSAIIYGGGTNVLRIGTATSFGGAISEKVRIDANGNVGIGTTSPSVKFSVGGAAGDTTGHGYFTGGLGVGVVNTTAGTIQTSGDVTIGGALTINGSAVSSATTGQFTFLALPTGTAINEGTIYINPASAGTNNVLAGFAVGGTEKVRIDAEGDVQITGLFNSTHTSGTNDLSGSLAVDQNTTLGDAGSDTLTVNAGINSNVLPSTDDTYSLGSAVKRWSDFYATNAFFDSIETSSTTLAAFIINSDNASADTEDATLEFHRGSLTPNAVLKWNSTNDRFEFNNFPLYLENKLVVAGTASSSIAGPLWLTGIPESTALQGASLYLNPGSASTNYSLFSVGVAGVERFRVDAEGDTTVRASLGIENALYDITDDTLTIDDDLQINGNDIKDSTGTTRITLGTTNTITGGLNVSGLTASRFVLTDASNNLVSTGLSSVLSNTLTDETGSGYAVFATSPQFSTSLTTDSTSFDLFNTTATTINFGGSATALNIGAGTGTTTVNNGLTVGGTDLVVQQATGNVGIGTTGPGAKLDVLSPGGAASATYTTTATNAGIAINSATGLGTNTRLLTGIGNSTYAWLQAQNSDNSTKNIAFNPVGGNVGIGTTAPAAKLDVAGAAGASKIMLTRTDSSTAAGGGLFWQTSDGTDKFSITTSTYISSAYLEINNGSSNLMAINTNGNVGIGTTEPIANLHITSTGAASSLLLQSADSFQTALNIRSGHSASVSTAAINFQRRDGTTLWQLGQNQIIGTPFEINFQGSNKVAITTDGNVGIGTVSPLSTLVINNANSGTTVGSGITGRIQASSEVNARTELGFSYDSALGTYTPVLVGYQSLTHSGFTSGSLYFATRNVTTDTAPEERLTILPDGNVGIGDTTPTALLSVGSGDVFRVNSSGQIEAATGIASSGTVNFSGLTASRMVFTDISKNLISTGVSADIANTISDETGSGALVFGTSPTIDSPTLSGTVNISGLTASRFVLTDVSSNLVSSGASSVLADTLTDETGSGTAVFNIEPTFANTIIGDTTARGWKLSTDTAGSGSRSYLVLDTDSTDGIGAGGDYLSILKDGVDATISNEDAGYLSLETSGEDRLRILSGGQVGIGVTSPIAKFTVNSATSTTAVGDAVITRLQGASAVNARTELGFTYDGASGYYTPAVIGYQSLTHSGNTSGSFYIATRDVTTDTAPTQRLTVLPDGNVGIGTTGPTGPLHVSGAQQTIGDLRWNLRLDDTTAMAANVGSGIRFVGKYKAAGDLVDFGGIAGLKENATEANTASYLGLYTTANPATTPTEKVRITSTGNVGIGTTAPDERLTVKSSGTGTNVIRVDASDGSALFDVGETAEGDAIVNIRDIAGGAKITFDASGDSFFTGGDVGIGTTNPGEKLEIGAGNLLVSTVTTGGGYQVPGTGSTAGQIFLNPNTGNRNLIIKGITIGSGDPLDGFQFNSQYTNTGSATGFLFSSGATNFLTILADGNVGIGTTAPGSKLALGLSASVSAVKTYTTDAQSGFDFYALTTGNLERYLDIYATASGNDGSLGGSNIRFFTHGLSSTVNATERMRIDRNGNVGVGTTNPGTKLELNGGVFTLTAADLTATNGNFNWTRNSTGSAGTFTQSGTGDILNLFDGATEVLTVLDGGNVGIGTTAPNANLEISSSATTQLRITGGAGVAQGGVLYFTNGGNQIGNYSAIYGGAYSAVPVIYPGTGNLRIASGISVGSTYAATASPTNGAIIDGNVGIGTTNPQNKLDVNSGAGVISLGAGGDENIGANIYYSGGYKHIANDYANILTMGGGAYNFYTGDTGAADSSVTLVSRMTIQNGGNVGIGTTAPDEALEVKVTGVTAGTYAVNGIKIRNSADISSKNTGLSFGSPSWADGAAIIAEDQGADGRAALVFATRGTIASGVITENMRIYNGNVGIGTADPNALLNVAGASNFEGVMKLRVTADRAVLARGIELSPSVFNGTQHIRGYGNSGGGGLLLQGYNTGGSVVNSQIFINPTSGASEITFSTGETLTQQMVINKDGNVGIGTTGPVAKLHISDGTVNSASGVPTALITAANQILTAESSILNIQSTSAQAVDLGGSINLGGRTVDASTASNAFAHIAGRKENGTSANYSGYLQFGTSDSASDLHEWMRISSTGNVGINDTTPVEARFVVQGGTGRSAAYLRSDDASYVTLDLDPVTAFRGLYVRNAAVESNFLGGLNVGSSGSSAPTQGLYVEGASYLNGNVGIGTTTPSHTLTVKGNSRFTFGAPGGATGSDASGLYQFIDWGTPQSATNVTLSVLQEATTAGSKLFELRSGASTFAAATSRFVVQSAGNVGIGTTTPGELLHIYKSTGTTLVKAEVNANSVVGFDIKKTGATTQEWKIVDGQSANGKLEIYDVTDSRSVMTFDGTGNVGIGTTAPSSKLNIVSSVSDSDALIVQDDARKIKIGRDTIQVTDLSDVASDLYLSSNRDIFFAGSGVWKSTGNVGIGTTAPDASLEIEKATSGTLLHLDGGSNNYLDLDRGGANFRGSYILSTAGTPKWTMAMADSDDHGDGTEFYIGTTASTLAGATSPKLWIEADGNVGIGTTGPGAKLNVNGTVRIDNTAATPVRLQIEGGTDDFASIYADTAFAFKNLILQRYGGNVGIGTTNPGYKLETVGDVNITGTYRVNGTPISATSNWTQTGNDIYYTTGNVGIGVTNPSTKLYVQSTTAAAEELLTIRKNAAWSTFTNALQSIKWRDGTNVVGGIGARYDGTHVNFDFHSLYNSGYQGESAVAMTITGDARLGIGDNTPTEATLVVGSAGAGNIYATFATSGTAGLCWDGSGASLITDCSSAPTDLAENFGTDDTTLVAGDLVVSSVAKEGYTLEKLMDDGSLSATSKAWVDKASSATREMLLGVVSTNPNQVYGDDGLFDPSENPIPITLAGRVPVNVALTSEPIAIGDKVTVSSDSPGKAEKATTAGVVIGTALSSYDPNNPPSDGKVLVFINVGWFDGGIDHNSFFSMVGYTGTSTPDFNLDLGNSLDSENILRAGNLLSVGADTVTLGTSDTSLVTVNGFVSKTRVAGADTNQTVLSVFGGFDGVNQRTAPYLTVSSGGMAGQASSTDADIFIIDHSGNVGIGTSTPAWKLNIATEGLPQLALTDMSAETDKKHGLISFIGGIFSIGTQIDALTSTSTLATSTLFTISNSGNVGIGTTTPARQLSVSGSVGFDGLGTGFGAGSLCLSNDGEVVYNSGSDSCLPSLRETKHDIVPLEQDALAQIAELIPVSFIYNDATAEAGQGAGRVRYGFIAEDSALVDKGFATYDAEGNITGVDDRALISLSIKALQELDSKLQETRDKIQGVASSTEEALNLGELELAASSYATSTASSTVVVTDKSLQVYDRFVEVVRSALSKLGIAIENGVVTIKNFATDMFSAKYAIINDLTVDALTINDKLCVDGVCLDKEQLKALLEERGGSSTSNNQITSTSTQTEVQNTDVQSTNSNQSADTQTTQTSTTTEPVTTTATTTPNQDSTSSSGTGQAEPVVEVVVEEVTTTEPVAEPVVEEVVLETTPTEEPAPEPVVEEPIPTE